VRGCKKDHKRGVLVATKNRNYSGGFTQVVTTSGCEVGHWSREIERAERCLLFFGDQQQSFVCTANSKSVAFVWFGLRCRVHLPVVFLTQLSYVKKTIGVTKF